ncbi:TagK domain-containing protein [Cupriavidus sp. NPDC089707]|uniref:TagK domain-containing protein n=1 Tax=Cupriavidus sp. NPDC089707 TaxID=3363963 RepID=UPI003808ED8D
MSDWQTRRAGTDPVKLEFEGASSAFWPGDAFGGTRPDDADPFSLVRPASSERTADAAADPSDVLEQLKREAEAALRDPNYVNTQAEAITGSAAEVPVEVDANPLRTLARRANHADTLMDMLDVAGHIDALIGPVESLDEHQLFSVAPAPDVLWLFAGDIAPTGRRDLSAPLTRREHHLVSMDSAYHPAQAQMPEPDHDA